MSLGRLVFPGLRWQAATGFAHEQPVIERALRAGAGGFIVFGGTPEAVRDLTTRVARAAGRPLVFGADLERGAGQQFEGLSEIPPPRALASLGDLDLIEAAGRLTALEARSVGIDWVYAPVADLDLDAANPIVQTRSFGDAPAPVGQAVARWIAGCQSAGALACAKHFPGHGRTTHDSHDRLPVVGATTAELEQTDLVPFRLAIGAGVRSIMTAHVAYPALDPAGAPATRSAPILGRLRHELGFDGLVVTDALTMEGVRGGLGIGDAALAALRAGVDCLLYPPEPDLALALERAAQSDAALASRIAESVSRLEAAVAWLAGNPPAGADRPPAAWPGGLGVARRTLRPAGRPAGSLRSPVELVVIDDDLDGAFPPTPSDWAARALAARGVPIGPGGSRVVLAFAEPRASKGRAGFGAASHAHLDAHVPGADLVALFAHERLAGSLPRGASVLVAWHRQRLMQEAVADWIVGRLA